MVLSGEAIAKIFADANAAPADQDKEHCWNQIQPLLQALDQQRDAALALLEIVERDRLSPERSLEVFEAIEASYPDDDDIHIVIGKNFACATNIDFLNAPPPSTPLAERIIRRLERRSRENFGRPLEVNLLDALATTARISGRDYDKIAEWAHRRLVEIRPGDRGHRYNFGLFLKTRGRFGEGMAENKCARDLSEKAEERYEWNYGICATGANDGRAALDVWLAMGHNIELGKFGLPEGNYRSCKVRLAERPLAERAAEQDSPGEEETVWIERLSPCHGVIRSVLYQNLGVDYGDVILFDGAPVTFHKYGEESVAVFPHLATLRRENYKFFHFAGTQSVRGQLYDLSGKLARDAIIYPHTENFEVLCMKCWMDADKDHAHTDKREFNVVSGKIAAPQEISAADLIQMIDSNMPPDDACRIFSPDLCEAAGLHERAKFERRRYSQLTAR